MDQTTLTPPIPPANSSVVAGPLVATIASSQPQTSPHSGPKESAPSVDAKIAVELVGNDAVENEPLPPEVASWMEKVSRDAGSQLPTEVVIADQSAVPPKSGYASAPVFVLPLGDVEYRKGLHESVDQSVRWLSQWCQRMVKKLGVQVTFG